MSAYVILEGDVRDETSACEIAARQSLRPFGGKILACGSWQLLVGEPAFPKGMIIRFPSETAAYAWYYSSGYKLLLDGPNVALDCRLGLIT